MAPMMLDLPVSEPRLPKIIPVCSDPSVVPSSRASKRTRDLWWLHGHPHSKRYSNPKLVSLASLVRHDGIIYKGNKAFLYPSSAGQSTPYQSMTWDEFDRVTETIALLYAHGLEKELSEANATEIQPTVALLGGGKSIEYFCTQLALQKLGIRVLLLAASNTLSALHQLLESCNALAVITDSNNSSSDTNGIRKMDMVEALPLDLDTPYSEVEAVKFQDFGDIWERHSFIIHSSGSTGMPKPIIHTNRSMMLIARMYRLFQEFNVENWFLLFPLYHIAGISIALSNLPNGQLLSFPPLSWPPSSSAIFAAWKTLASMGHPVDCVHCAPTLIENMYEYILENGGDFNPLVSLKLLQPGGAVLSESIVNALVANGVNVKTTYGSTEIGPPFRSIPPTRDNPKCYSFRNLYPDNPLIKMERVGEGMYECVVYKGFELAAELWEGRSDNEPYRTNDLFVEDPPRSGFFTLQGRRDDILVHTNGENTSAGPLQLDIQTSSKFINKVLALGHSRPCVGLLVELHQKYNPDEESIHESIWEIVKQVNIRYPTHSQVMRRMILILPKGSVLPVTPKGNIRRKEAETIFTSEIDQLYSDNFSSSISSASSSFSSSSEPLSEHLRNILASLSHIPVSEIHNWTTLYDLGIDSRLALSIRSSLSSHLGRSISLSTIFENPSISKLVSALEPSTPLSSGYFAEVKPLVAESINRMISKLEAEFKTWPPRSLKALYPPVERETILLTGASGSLGTALLETLSASDNVEKIYAMARGPGNFEKLQSSLERRGMDPTILSPGGKIEVLNFSMQDPLLGLDIETYYTLAKSVTTIVQSAWKMDFNRAVEEFEGDCIRNTMNLLRFCHTGRAKTMVVTSSISTCMGPGVSSSTVSESPIGDDPTVALSTGYAQSKYIVERLTQTASSHLGLSIKLLRLGQLCGSIRTGHWNTDEMWPILFASSFHASMNAIPVFSGKQVDWVPVDVAAATISDVLLGHKGQESENGNEKIEKGWYAVHNIVNPYRIKWEEMVAMIHRTRESVSGSGGRKLEEVSMKEWVHRLTVLADRGVNPNELPGLRLLQYFEGMVCEEGKSKVFKTQKTQKMSESLREVGPFCPDWIEKIFGVWRKEGFMA